MNNELDALITNGTWKIVPLPPGHTAVGCKWVYKIKFLPNGAVERYKAHLVAKGFDKKHGIDYQDTFSPVAKQVTIRALVLTITQLNLPMFHLDVSNIFLNGDLYEEVYMNIPLGLPSQGESSILPVQGKYASYLNLFTV